MLPDRRVDETALKEGALMNPLVRELFASVEIHAFRVIRLWNHENIVAVTKYVWIGIMVIRIVQAQLRRAQAPVV